MLHLGRMITVCTITCFSGVAQTQNRVDAAVPAFEVASVRRAPFVAGSPCGERIDPQQVSYRCATLRPLLMKAWGVPGRLIIGPPWLDTEYYDIKANLPRDTDKTQIPRMLQRLLIERFGLQAHEENRISAVYVLVASRSGARLVATKAQDIPRNPDGTADASAYQKKSSKLLRGLHYGPGRLIAGGVTLGALATALSNMMDRPVMDLTGISGEFDFNLEVSPDDVLGPQRVLFGFAAGVGSEVQAAAELSSGSVLRSLRKVGLDLEGRKLGIKWLVVDQAQRIPTDN